MSRCKDIREYAFDEPSDLAEQGRADVEHHLASCAGCRAAFEWAGAVVDNVARESRASIGDSEEAMLACLSPVMRETADRLAHQTRRSADRATWWRSWFLLPVPALAALALFVLWPQQPPAPMALAAAVALSSGETTWWSSQDSIRGGTDLHTSEASRLELTVGHDQLAMKARTSMRMERLSDMQVRLSLSRGAVVIRAAKRRPGQRLTVHAPFGEVEVVGTLFEVSAEGEGSVIVEEGRVQVTMAASGRRIAVGPRQSLSVVDGAVLDINDSGLGGQISAVVRKSPGDPGALSLTGKPAAATVVVDGRITGRAPLFVRLAPGEHHYRVEAQGRVTTGKVMVETGKTRAVSFDVTEPAREMPETEARVQPRANTKSKEKHALHRTVKNISRTGDCRQAHDLVRGQAADAQTLSLVAQCFQSRGKYAQALDLYRTIHADFRGTPTAQNALFEIGRMAEKLDRDGEARDAYAAYARIYPRGPLAGDALFRLCASHMEARQFDDALACVREYRKRFRSGTRLADAVFLEATILKDVRHAYAKAAKAYLRYLGLRHADRVEEAMYSRVLCLSHTDRSAFEQAAADYLAKFPKGAHAGDVARLQGR